MKLTEEEIERHLAETDGWKREEGKWIVRKYRFDSFAGAIAFVNAVAGIAEQMNHHPFISIDYKVVTLRMTSWHAGGLTELDFQSAAAYEKAYRAK